MSGRLRVLLWLCCFCAFGLRAEEAIQAYDVRMQVEPSGDVLVTERIAVMAEGKMIVRGIYRDIPVRYRLGNGLSTFIGGVRFACEDDLYRPALITQYASQPIRILQNKRRPLVGCESSGEADRQGRIRECPSCLDDTIRVFSSPTRLDGKSASYE